MFSECAALVVNLKIKDLLAKAAARCQEGAEEIFQKVASLGGEPEDRRSLGSTADVAWIDVKSNIVGMSDREVLDACVLSEEAARSLFDKALREVVSADVKSLVEQQRTTVMEHYELVRSLRASFVYGQSKS